MHRVDPPSRTTDGLIQAALRGADSGAQARRLAKNDPEVLALAPLAASRRIDRLNRRVGQTAREEWADADARRLTKRLRRYREYIFTFPDDGCAPSGSHFGQRQVRPAVILRKNSRSYCSDRGAATQAAPMSAHGTLRLGGLNPAKTMADALTTCRTAA